MNLDLAINRRTKLAPLGFYWSTNFSIEDLDVYQDAVNRNPKQALIADQAFDCDGSQISSCRALYVRKGYKVDVEFSYRPHRAANAVIVSDVADHVIKNFAKSF